VAAVGGDDQLGFVPGAVEGPGAFHGADDVVAALHDHAGDVAQAYNGRVQLSIEIDREDDGRWIAEALELPGVMMYGATREEAISNTERLAIEVIADRIQQGELPASAFNVSFQVLSEQLAGD